MYELDPHHSETIANQMGIDDPSKSFSAPGTNTRRAENDDVDRLLEQANANTYRQLAGRANVPAQDRCDTQCATKIIASGMRSPMKMHRAQLKQLSRFLLRKNRFITKFLWQKRPDVPTCACDSDHAGDNISQIYTRRCVVVWESPGAAVELDTIGDSPAER